MLRRTLHLASLFIAVAFLVVAAYAGNAPQVTLVQTIAGSPVGAAMSGFADGNGTNARFYQPRGVVVDPNTGIVYIADYNNCALRAMNSTFYVATIAGSPPSLGKQCNFPVDASVGTNARFVYPYGLCIHANVLYVADSGPDRIRAVSLGSGGTYAVTTIAGQSSGTANGIGTSAQFYSPTGIAYHAATNSLLIADNSNSRIRSVSLLTTSVTTVAGGTDGLVDGVGSTAHFYHPRDVSVDSNTGLAYVTDYNNHALRVINVASRSVTTLAGSYPTAAQGYMDGNGTTARLSNPVVIMYDNSRAGLVVVDELNHAIRWVSVTGNVHTMTGSPPPTTASGHVDGDATSARFNRPYGITVHPTRPGVYIVSDGENHAIRFVFHTSNRLQTLSTSPTQFHTTSSTLTTVQSLSRTLSLSQSPSTSAASASTSSTPAASSVSASQSDTWDVPSQSASSSGSASTLSLLLPSQTQSATHNASATLIVSASTSTSLSPTQSLHQTGSAGSQSWNASTTTSTSQSCEHPFVKWHRCRYEAINLTTDYLTVALQPSATPFTAVGVSQGAVWTSLSLPLSTLQRGSPFALNLSSSSDLGVLLRSASVVHGSGGNVASLVAADFVPQSPDATPQRFRLLKLSLPPSTKWIQPGAAAVTLSLVFGGCDNVTPTAATILVGLLPVPLMEQTPIVSSVVGSTTAVVSVTTATMAARVGAVRTLLLCTTTGAATGGLLGLSIARPEVDGDDVEVLPSARGAVVGNVVAVCVVGAVLCVVCCVYSARCGVSLCASALRLALPSSLLPVLVAVLPSTMGAVVYLSHSSNSKGGDVVALAVVGALLCAVPLGMLAWIAFVLPSRLGLVVKPGKPDVASASSSSGILGTLQLLHRSMSKEQWVWEAKESTATSDKQNASLVAPERAGRIVLIEHRLLWFSVLDVALVAFIAGLGVGSAFGGPSTCRASLIAVVVLLALETVLIAALKPFATLRSQVTVVLTLGCTTLSAVLQLVAFTTDDGEDALLASAVVDLVVLGMAITRMVLFDAPEMLLAAWGVLREIAAGAAAASVQTVAKRDDLPRGALLMPSSSPSLPALPLRHLGPDDATLDADATAVAPVEDDDEELDELFWGSDGRARGLSTAAGDDVAIRCESHDEIIAGGVRLASELRQPAGPNSDLFGLYTSLGA